MLKQHSTKWKWCTVRLFNSSSCDHSSIASFILYWQALFVVNLP